jgi:hypothetical protein
MKSIHMIRKITEEIHKIVFLHGLAMRYATVRVLVLGERNALR